MTKTSASSITSTSATAMVSGHDSITSPTTSASPTGDIISNKHVLGKGAGAGIGVGIAVAGIVVLMGLLIFLKRRRVARQKTAIEDSPDVGLGEVHVPTEMCPSTPVREMGGRDAREMYVGDWYPAELDSKIRRVELS